MKENKQEFSELIDKNFDNKIDLNEFCDWNIQSFEEIIKGQVNEIFQKCDLNKDDLLDRNEIKTNVEIFKTFEFTNFGEDLFDKQKVRNNLHEEF